MQKYHMRRKDRQILDSVELERILKAGRFAVLALCRDNEPYCVTLNYGYDAEKGTLFFHCAPVGQKLDFIKANPQCCATIILDHGYQHGECEHYFESLIVRGALQIIDDGEEKRRGMMTMINHLEADPTPVIERNLAQLNNMAHMTILRLDIHDIAGKIANSPSI